MNGGKNEKGKVKKQTTKIKTDDKELENKKHEVVTMKSEKRRKGKNTKPEQKN